MAEESTGFDDGYEPPFPWCRIQVSNPPRTRSRILRGYIDTGSDGSILPGEIGGELDLDERPVMRVLAHGIGAAPEERVLYGALVKVGPVEVAAAVDVRNDVDIALLGRDILRYVKLTIDPKSRRVSIQDP